VAELLKERPSADVRALVVWEPVLPTDWGSPSPTLTSIIRDPRAIQFWDHDRKLSELLGGREKLESLARVELVGFRMNDVIWDAALVYPPETPWGSPAALMAAPVVRCRNELAGAMARYTSQTIP
jgi:hypothetical protein